MEPVEALKVDQPQLRENSTEETHTLSLANGSHNFKSSDYPFLLEEKLHGSSTEIVSGNSVAVNGTSNKLCFGDEIKRMSDNEVSFNRTSRERSSSALSRNGTSPSEISIKGYFVRRTKIIKHFKRVTVSEQYFEDGEQAFSIPPVVEDTETDSQEQSVSVGECSKEDFLAAQKLSKKSRIEEVVWDDGEGIKTIPMVQEPSEADASSTAGSDVAVPLKRARGRILLSEDEDEPESKPTRGKRFTKVTDEFYDGMIVLAKYSDNIYYPAQILRKDSDLLNHFTVQFSDSKEKESVHRSFLLKPKDWMTIGRDILVKVGKGTEGGEYEDGKIVEVVKIEGVAPRYIVKLGDEERSVNLSEVALNEDETLQAKFENGQKEKTESLDHAAGPALIKHDMEKFVKDALVFACWIDGRYYPGKIHKIDRKNDEYGVKFLDGEESKVTREQLVLADDLVVPGAIIQTQLRNKSYDSATITSVSGTGDNIEVQITLLTSGNHESRHIQELCYLEEDIPRPASFKVLKSKEEKPAQSSQARVDSSKPEKKPSSKKAKVSKKAEVIDVPSDEEDAESSKGSIKIDSSKSHRIGSTSFAHNEPIFGLWDDGRWYAGRVTSIRGSKFGVDWCENDQKNYLPDENIVRASEILRKGIKVNVIVPNKNFYDEVILEEYMENGNHLVKGKKGHITERKFDDMMLQKDVVNQFRKHGASGDIPSTSSAKTTPKKRVHSPSPEPDSFPKSKVTKRGRKSIAEETRDSSQDKNDKPFTSCSFVVTSGSEKDSTFDREVINKKIIENGGSILSTFDELWKSGGKRFLISPTPCRTAKYLQCLAANIPCVSHKWILETAESGKTTDFEKHRLPTGKSGTLNNYVKWVPRKALLDNLRVGLVGGVAFQNTWVPAFKAAKAEPMFLTEKEYSSRMNRFDVVIAEDNPDPRVYTSCETDSVPLVTVEWIIQTLIHGSKQPYDSYTVQDPTGMVGVDNSINTSRR